MQARSVKTAAHMAVAATVISGVDYFFGLRGMLEEQRERGAGEPPAKVPAKAGR